MPKTDKSFPADWGQPITARGVTKNVKARCYNVRLSVAGKQVFLNTARSQSEAAAIYDVALWKLCPKMIRRPVPNSAETFSFCTQHRVDALCPRANLIYDSLPFLKAEDAYRSEEGLRTDAVARPATPQEGEMSDYDKAIDFLRRAEVELADLEVKLANRMGKLTRLHKLAAVPRDTANLTTWLKTARLTTDSLKQHMEEQRPYYKKLVDGAE